MSGSGGAAWARATPSRFVKSISGPAANGASSIATPKGDAVFYGEYREITPPSRVVFTEIFEPFPDAVSVVTAELSEEDGKTRFIATVRYPSMQVRDMVIATGMSRGAGISYDRLEDLVAELQRA